ncbi:MAG: hypothetical protein KUF77_12895 [Candidatus Thiodiazotropha sp. (ex Lucina aurantia)]|nr:hypothetical protein [Candidatus Thiodiazotropha sp. (ex Lucina pensylvanica)]MBT3024002.1 hypothetical protein [Candidatus Thiodiazotropha taylori]MBV2098424.1 hypothetical protein [Candidatus Thiodiazotropha sp. (ex Codakia orbicularis)]MBV2103914.1 hypothetical protein [Candidatus Thiodiazotropha sp. (ex Lucina aurantia)]MBV2118353.1 hypothetical protein [Candidatus Thiodiazotropha sp. (ex Lucina aurantia)]
MRCLSSSKVVSVADCSSVFSPTSTSSGTTSRYRALARYCEVLWTPGKIVEDTLHHVREQVGEKQVVLGLSGGIDSSVVAAMLHRAIDERLFPPILYKQLPCYDRYSWLHIDSCRRSSSTASSL